jgi:hypothetical protein
MISDTTDTPQCQSLSDTSLNFGMKLHGIKKLILLLFSFVLRHSLGLTSPLINYVVTLHASMHFYLNTHQLAGISE